MYRVNPLKKKLRKGEQALSCWLHLASPVAAEIVSLIGYDGAIIDLEHGPTDYLGATMLMQAMSASLTSPIIRVPANDEVAIKRALDTGPEGIMIPSVDNLAAAKAAVTACLYPPQGTRGVAHILNRASSYGLEDQRYLADKASELLIICQIESLEAIDNIQTIAKIPEIDMLFIGPVDLSGSVGALADFTNTEFKQARFRAESLIQQNGKLLGGIPIPGDSPREMFSRGYSFVVASSDVLLLRDAAQRNLAENAPSR